MILFFYNIFSWLVSILPFSKPLNHLNFNVYFFLLNRSIKSDFPLMFGCLYYWYFNKGVFVCLCTLLEILAKSLSNCTLLSEINMYGGLAKSIESWSVTSDHCLMQSSVADLNVVSRPNSCRTHPSTSWLLERPSGYSWCRWEGLSLFSSIC